jgi:DNA mismatch repair protein MutS
VEQDRYVWLDRFTIRNLEITGSHNDNARTLLDVVDKTLTPMGSRLMRRWILMPLKEVEPIEERLHVVDTLIRDAEIREKLAQNIKIIGDLERLITKAAVGRINPREMQQLRRSLLAVEEVRLICTTNDSDALKQLGERINSCIPLAERIGREITEEPPAKIEKGGVITGGVNDELDKLRSMAGSGKEYLMNLQQKESEATGIPSLRIGFNNIFGYYFEVYNTHKDKVPPEWTRKQTLTNAERYITPELKEYEDKILGAEERIMALEIE